MPGRIIIIDTRVPSKRKKEKISRVTVELLDDGQHPQRIHGAEPHKHDAWRIKRGKTKINVTSVTFTRTTLANQSIYNESLLKADSGVGLKQGVLFSSRKQLTTIRVTIEEIFSKLLQVIL